MYPFSSLFFWKTREQLLWGCWELYQEPVPWPQHAKRCQRNLQSHDLRDRHAKRQICLWRSYRYYHQRKPQGLRALLIPIIAHVVPSTNRLGIWAILGRKCPVMTPYDGEQIRAPLEVRHACLDGLSHSFQSGAASEFKEPEARSQKTQAPGLVLQLTTQLNISFLRPRVPRL